MNGWSVYLCALSLVLWSTTGPEKVTAGLPMIQSICLSVGLAADQPDARDRNSRLNRALSFMSPVRNSGVFGSAACSFVRAVASARTAASRIAFVPPTARAGLWVLSTQIDPSPAVEVNLAIGTWIIGPPYRIDT